MNYQKSQLGDVCDFIRGVSFDGTEVLSVRAEGYVPILRAGNIGDILDIQNDLVWAPARRVSKEQYLKINDIAICMASGSPAVLGKTAKLNQDFYGSVGAFCGIIRVKKADPDYISFWFKSNSYLSWRDSRARGVNIQNLRPTEVQEIFIHLPPLAEQRRIAAILGKADRLRRLRRTARQLGETVLQSVFVEMFGEPERNPKGWEKGQIRDLCKLILDCPHATPIHSEIETKYASIRSSDIQNGFLDWSTTKYVEYGEYYKRIARGVVLAGDVVYCREGARFGNAARIPKNLDKKICLGQRMMMFRADPKKTTPEFLWGILESSYIYKQAENMLGGSASPHVNIQDIKKFSTIIPPLVEQERFTQAVVRYDNLRVQQREAERQAEMLFQALLRQAFQEKF